MEGNVITLYTRRHTFSHYWRSQFSFVVRLVFWQSVGSWFWVCHLNADLPLFKFNSTVFGFLSLLLQNCELNIKFKLTCIISFTHKAISETLQKGRDFNFKFSDGNPSFFFFFLLTHIVMGKRRWSHRRRSSLEWSIRSNKNLFNNRNDVWCVIHWFIHSIIQLNGLSCDICCG